MTASDSDLISRLEGTELEEARIAIHNLTLGHSLDSPNQALCLAWLKGKDDAAKISREEESISIARKALANSDRAVAISRLATSIAIMAMILSIIMGIQKIIELYSK